MLIDLQVHSTYSDGYLTPTELAGFLKSQGVAIASLTDHNTVAGQEEFLRACRKEKIKAIPGLELYVKLGGRKFNLLWFNFKDDPALHSLLRESQLRRKNMARRMLRALKKHGFKIKVSATVDKYAHYIAINHLVDDVLNNPYNRKKIKRELKVKIIREDDVIKNYFRNPEVGILRESYLNMKRVVNLKKKLGGQLILNHPGKYNQLKLDFLLKLKKIGVLGLEVLSPHHNLGTVMYAQFLARELKFISTGGSDFHKFERTKSRVKCSHNYYRIDSSYLNGVEKIIG
ncbi:MAG: PHP domain-containing protein [Patescibacteria group bacterium]|jgi:hypothetical protein